MRLIEWQASNWRGLEDQRIGPLSPHLNLITGPNESGKSRMVEALWFGLFESSKGKAQHKQELESWRSPGTAPFIRIRFAIRDVEYTVEKQFLKGPYTRLSGGGETLDGDEAEERLRSLLRIREGKRTGVTSADLGLWPLLWLRQGDSRVVPHEHMNEDSRSWLQDSLAAQIGEATVGPEGQVLLQRAREEFERYFTATGQPGKALRDAHEDEARARQAFEEAKALQAATQQTATQLQQCDIELAELEPRIQKQRQVFEQAQGKAADARRAREELKARKAEVNWRAGELQAAEQQRLERERREEELGRIAKHAETARSELDKLDTGVQRLEQESEAAKAAASEADAAQREARALLQRVQKASERQRMDSERKQLAQQLDNVSKVQEQQAAVERELRDCGAITASQVQALRDAATALTQARARLEGAATAVELRALDDVIIDGKPMARGDTDRFAVADDRVLRVGEQLEVAISPGGGDVLRLRDAVADQESELRSQLQGLAVNGVSDAEALLERRTALARQLQGLRQRLQDVAPESPEHLAYRLRELDAILQADPQPDPQSLPDPHEAERSERKAESRLQGARRQRDMAQAALGECREARARQEQYVRSLQEQMDRLQAELAALPKADALLRIESERRKAWQETVAARDHAENTFKKLGGEQAELDREQAQKALAGLENRQRDLINEAHALRGRLERATEDAPYESLQEQEQQLALAEQQAARLQRQADAARRLWTLLSDRRRAAQQRLSGPVMERIGPYLGEIFPGTALALNEELQVVGLDNDGVREAFEALSGGAQEQLGILVRIGLAEVLRGDDTLPLVLDDALINTDAERIREVQRLLFRASREQLQIILLTCHGQLFDSLGADKIIPLHGTRKAG